MEKNISASEMLMMHKISLDPSDPRSAEEVLVDFRARGLLSTVVAEVVKVEDVVPSQEDPAQTEAAATDTI